MTKNWQYGQCVQLFREPLAAHYPLVLDPEMPTDRIRYHGPVYQWRTGLPFTCVPVDAQIGERIIGADVMDSSTQLRVYEIVEIDEAVGEELAPWEPRAKCRRARVKHVLTGRSHMDRMLNRTAAEGQRQQEIAAHIDD